MHYFPLSGKKTYLYSFKCLTEIKTITEDKSFCTVFFYF